MCAATISKNASGLHPTTIGFSVQVDEMLLDIANLEQDVNRYVFLIMDEVHIKQDLIFDKHFKNLYKIPNIFKLWSICIFHIRSPSSVKTTRNCCLTRNLCVCYVAL